MTLSLFEGFGIEIELMIVDAETLAVAPLADRLMEALAGTVVDEVERGSVAVSNELVNHVIELKTNGPAPSLDGVAAAMQREVAHLESLLAPMGARLLGGGMHPWMDPAEDTVLWPHEHGPIYAAFDRIFDARGHGWANVQSMHVNLPYRGDDELRRLHSAIRLVLPLIPGLCASSPIADGRSTGHLDERLQHYGSNAKRMPSVTGAVIPPVVRSEEEYRAQVLAPIAADLAPHDPEGLLDPEWVNARGAIVRFVRDSIEIRLCDAQEHPGADLARARLIIALVRRLVEEEPSSLDAQEAVDTDALVALLRRGIVDADEAMVDDPALLRALGVSSPRTMGELWRDAGATDVPLARRLSGAAGHEELLDQTRRLADCLRMGESFRP